MSNEKNMDCEQWYYKVVQSLFSGMIVEEVQGQVK